MAKFDSLNTEDLVRLDAEGRLTGINPIPEDILAAANMRNPEHVAKLNQIFDAYTGRDPIDARQATAGWLQRFGITKDDPRYEAEFDRLLEKGSSNQAVMAEERRAGERAELLWATDGDLEANCVYLNEGNDAVCSECDELGGEEMTLAEFEENGMMPSDRCLGGSNCRCVLIPIERVNLPDVTLPSQEQLSEQAAEEDARREQIREERASRPRETDSGETDEDGFARFSFDETRPNRR